MQQPAEKTSSKLCRPTESIRLCLKSIFALKLLNILSLVHTELAGTWDQKDGRGERKRSGSRGNVPAYIKLAPQISILYWIQIKVQFSLLSYLDLFAHHASQKHMYFY